MTNLPIPGTGEAVVVASASGAGPQQWAGAAAVAFDEDGSLVLAYRVRGAGGDRNVIARSTDGVQLTTVASLYPQAIGAAMVERPAVARTADGRWRMWVSAATPGSKHWSVALLEAATPEGLPTAEPRPAFPGDPALVAVKDPVIRHRAGRWEAWLCCHPLDVEGAEDRMTTAYATSTDGLDWVWHGTVLGPRPDHWDARGARVTAVLGDGHVAYDGRPTAEANWFEQTGVAATADDGLLRSVSDEPVYDARYLTVLPLPDGSTRIWYEFRLPDESHELRTELITAGAVTSPG